jgi:hypothetical protein
MREVEVRDRVFLKFGMLGTLIVFCWFSAPRAVAQSMGDAGVRGAAGTTIVNTKFGGQIFGFDIDQNGTEGVLSEAQTLPDGNVLAAVETFDQKTGKIIKVVSQSQTQDDFVTMGIVGKSVGIIENEHVISLFNVKRVFGLLNPLSSNSLNGTWKPPLDKKHIVGAVSRSQGSDTAAVFVEDLTQNFTPTVFSTNVVTNTFGPMISITDENFTSGSNPALAYDTGTNQAVLAHSTLGNPFVPPVIALVDLKTGEFTSFNGAGLGDVNGLAVDSETHIACTTTEIDFSVQFYDLTTHTGFSQILPNAQNQLFSGTDVQFDPIHKLFLVGQPVSSSAPSGSTIYVFDELGNLKETINGFSFSNTFNVIPMHIALHPSNRTGYVDGPASNVSQLQSFSY